MITVRSVSRRSPPAGLRLRALVLAAGRGERLRPLTAATPKPLLPVAGEPVLVHTLRALVRLGCEAVAINTHHLAAQIPAALGERFGPLPLVYSHEPELLGTLGALGPLRDFFAEADLVVIVNGDSLCRWPLRRLVHQHRRSGAAATLLVTRRAQPAAFGGGLALDASGRVLALRGAARAAAAGGPATAPASAPGGAAPAPPGTQRYRVFAGAHVLDPALLARAEPRPSDIVGELYEPLLAEGETLATLSTSATWHDLGTPARYLAGVLDFAGWRARGGLRVDGEATVERGARLRRSVLERGAAVAAGARVDGSLLLPGARVGEGCRVRHAVIGPVELPAASRVEGQMVTPRAWGLGARGSLVGELVYTPL